MSQAKPTEPLGEALELIHAIPRMARRYALACEDVQQIIADGGYGGREYQRAARLRLYRHEAMHRLAQSADAWTRRAAQ